MIFALMLSQSISSPEMQWFVRWEGVGIFEVGGGIETGAETEAKKSWKNAQTDTEASVKNTEN